MSPQTPAHANAQHLPLPIAQNSDHRAEERILHQPAALVSAAPLVIRRQVALPVAPAALPIPSYGSSVSVVCNIQEMLVQPLGQQ